MKIARLRPRHRTDSDDMGSNINSMKTIDKFAKRETYGIVDDKTGLIATRDDITFATGVPIPRGITEFLFDGWYDEIIKKEIPYNGRADQYHMLAPLPRPGKIVCLAFNYKDHAREQGLDAPSDPVLFIKPQTSLTGTETEIRCPDFVKHLDYEVELAIIIKDTCKNVAEDDAYAHIFGYMILNDLSARDIQFADKQFTRGKGFDDFAPCGPWITTADEVAQPQNLRLTTKINGTIRQDSTTDMMLLKIPQIISKISRVMTLEPGDVIATGTPAGVALKNPGVPYLKDGDTIEMEIEGLGAIHNTIRKVRHSPAHV